MANPSPTRTFTTELALAGSPRTNVGYHYLGTQSTPMAGLAPARHAAVWAANGGHGEEPREASGAKREASEGLPSFAHRFARYAGRALLTTDLHGCSTDNCL